MPGFVASSLRPGHRLGYEVSTQGVVEATNSYEGWLAGWVPLVAEDLAAKHEAMAEAAFPYLRATLYRWAQLWPSLCGDLDEAPVVTAVGDLYVENFGTWRDAEGRLAWGVNDFDEALDAPYTVDLVRLAASAQLATADCRLGCGPDEQCAAVLESYRAQLRRGGRPFVLAEKHRRLTAMALARLRDPRRFWARLGELPTVGGPLPAGAEEVLARALPEGSEDVRLVWRRAGLGSLGRPRVVAIARFEGGRVAREAKALAPCAWGWSRGDADDPAGDPPSRLAATASTAVRCCDPFLTVTGRWVVRRLAPDCCRVPIDDMASEGDERRLLEDMGAEAANVHLGRAGAAPAVLADLDRRGAAWLPRAALAMVEAVKADHATWRSSRQERQARESG